MFLVALRTAFSFKPSVFRNMANLASGDLSKNRFVWIDCEMTGLNVATDKILEISCVITTPDLKELHDGINLIIHESDETLASMNPWCINHHGKTGLTEECRKSKLNLPDAEKELYNYITKYTINGGKNLLAGNSVGYDKQFIAKYMLSVNSLLHYRIIDVSTIKELCRHWQPEKFLHMSSKKNLHRSMDDILESIGELREYKKFIFAH